MKAYSIGRELDCNIVINDNTDVISRRHATLNVSPSGKMTIVDQSHNGTYVNGIRISSNVPVPVTRKDNISFAHIATLDWKMIPKPMNGLLYAALAVVVVLVLGVGGFFGFNYLNHEVEPATTPVDTCQVEKRDTTDSTKIDPQKEKTEKKEKSDSTNVKKEKSKEVKATKPVKEEKKKTSQKETTPEKTCPTCKKPLDKCEHKGKHPENNTRGDR